MEFIRVELKYCEYCGGLLLRAAGDAVVYCAACLRKLADMPQTAQPDRLPTSPDLSDPEQPASNSPSEDISAGAAELDACVQSAPDLSRPGIGNSPDEPQSGVDLQAVACEPLASEYDVSPPALPPHTVAEAGCSAHGRLA